MTDADRTNDAGGRPPYEPTEKERAQVKLLSAMGIRDYDIATVIGVSPPTLRKYFGAELEIGHIEANAKVAQSLYQQATRKDKPNVAAAIFWLKARAGWRESPSEGGMYKPPPVGKKEQAQADAVTAAAGTGWEDLLPGTRVQ